MGSSWRGRPTGGLADDVDPEAASSGIEIGGERINPTQDLRKFKRLHKWDPFLEVEKLDTVDSALASGDLEKEAAIEGSLLLEDSPYPEVRVAVGSPTAMASVCGGGNGFLLTRETTGPAWR
jgi:hypothetical protein